MPVKINSGDLKQSRRDTLMIHPAAVVVNESKNGRCKPVSQEAVDVMASSILEKGQLQPVRVRKIEEDKVELVAGYTRYKALLKIHRDDPDSQVLLWCSVTTCNELEAFKQNIDENKQRNAVSAIDDAFNARRLREQYGQSEDEIATILGCSTPWLSMLNKLLVLPEELQDKVASGELKTTVAMKLADMSDEERTSFLAEMEESGTKVTGAAIIKKTREKRAESGKKTSRSTKEVREYFESKLGEGELAKVSELSKYLVEFIAGTRSDKDMDTALDSLFSRKKAAKVETEVETETDKEAA